MNKSERSVLPRLCVVGLYFNGASAVSLIFSIQYLGSMLIKDLRGTESTQDACAKMRVGGAAGPSLSLSTAARRRSQSFGSLAQSPAVGSLQNDSSTLYLNHLSD